MKGKSQTKDGRQSYMIRKYAMSETKKVPPKEPIAFMVIDDENIGLNLPFSLSNDLIRSFIKQNGAVWDHNYKLWKIPKAYFTPIRS